MDRITHTQHCPICVSVQPVVVPQPTPFRGDTSTVERHIEIATQQNSITALKTLNLTFATFDCLAASNWPPGHPRSDHHVSNPHRPDYY